MDVDDFIEGGKETHRKALEVSMKKYRYGKSIDPWSVGQQETLFAGRRVVQHHDYCVTVSMDEYVKNKLRPIEVPEGYLSNTKEVSEEMLTNMKGVNGCLGSTTFDQSIWIRSDIVSTDFGSQCGSETVSSSAHHHHDLATSFR